MAKPPASQLSPVRGVPSDSSLFVLFKSWLGWVRPTAIKESSSFPHPVNSVIGLNQKCPYTQNTVRQNVWRPAAEVDRLAMSHECGSPSEDDTAESVRGGSVRVGGSVRGAARAPERRARGPSHDCAACHKRCNSELWVSGWESVPSTRLLEQVRVEVQACFTVNRFHIVGTLRRRCRKSGVWRVGCLWASLQQ